MPGARASLKPAVKYLRSRIWRLHIMKSCRLRAIKYCAHTQRDASRTVFYLRRRWMRILYLCRANNKSSVCSMRETHPLADILFIYSTHNTGGQSICDLPVLKHDEFSSLVCCVRDKCIIFNCQAHGKILSSLFLISLALLTKWEASRAIYRNHVKQCELLQNYSHACEGHNF